jgi:hypothetical protein
MSARVITVLQKAEGGSRYALNVCQVTRDGNSWRADWTDEQLKIEQLQDQLIAAGADEDLVEEFRQAIFEHTYQDGVDTGRESASAW